MKSLKLVEKGKKYTKLNEEIEKSLSQKKIQHFFEVMQCIKEKVQKCIREKEKHL